MPSGLVTRLEAVQERLAGAGLDVSLVMNRTYTGRLQMLIDHARTSTSATGDLAYRILQVLTHARGTLVI